MAIALGAVAPPQEDVIECTVHLGATKEVSSFNLVLQNWDKKYSPSGTYPILVGQTGGIGIGRGANAPAVISLKIEGVKYENPNSTESYVRVTGRCWGEKLFRKVVTKVYENKKGEYIVKDLIDNYVGLGHVRATVELIENTDTTYTILEYEDTPVWDILKYIAGSADKDGVIGYDFRIAPDGLFEFFPVNSKNSAVDLTDKLEVGEYSKDIFRIRNKIWVYGYGARKEPADGDAAESLTNWGCQTGNLYLDDVEVKVGTYRVRHVPAESSPVRFWRTFDSIKIDEGTKLKFWFKSGAPYYATKKVRVKTSEGNYFEADFPVGKSGDLNYDQKELSLGKAFEYNAESNPTGVWTKVGSPSWYSITVVEFFLTPQNGVAAIIDGLHFDGLRFRAVAEDTESQHLYTDDEPRELTETDEELWSDNECELRAKALLAYLKDPAEYLKVTSTAIDYGLAPMLSADKVHVELPNENVDSDFRTDSVDYHVDAKTQTLELTLELGKVPPQMADYLYGLRRFTVNVENLARTKLGKKGIPHVFSVTSGDVYEHHKRHEVGDDSGVKYATAADGGADPISGWIAPSHIGPFNDVAAVIWFRTKNKESSAIIDHMFAPTDTGRGLLGYEDKIWKEVWALYVLLPTDGFMRIRAVGGSDPYMLLDKSGINFGSGTAATDVYLKRIADKTFELKADSLLPAEHEVTELGSLAKRFKKIYLSDFLLWNHLYPPQNNTFDLGSTDYRWRDLWLSGKLMAIWQVACNLDPDATNTRSLGNADVRWIVHAGYLNCNTLNVNGTEVLSAAKVLHNVTADAAIITSGTFSVDRVPDMPASKITSDRFSMDRMPVGTAGNFLKGYGAGVNPSYDALAAGDIQSGRFGVARMPDGTNGYFLKAVGAGSDPQWAALDTGNVQSGRFPFSRLPAVANGMLMEGTGGDVTEVDPNGRYIPASHGHTWAEISVSKRTENVDVAKVGGGTRTLHYVDSLYTGYTDS